MDLCRPEKGDAAVPLETPGLTHEDAGAGSPREPLAAELLQDSGIPALCPLWVSAPLRRSPTLTEGASRLPA